MKKYYCPEGSSQMLECTAGQYCETEYLVTPTDYCHAGYICPPASSSPKQEDCPTGHYCPTGSGLPEPCANGTYSPTTRLKDATDCLACDDGYYCQGTGLSTKTGLCDAGNFWDGVLIFYLGSIGRTSASSMGGRRVMTESYQRLFKKCTF